jgi:hypothetical protein
VPTEGLFVLGLPIFSLVLNSKLAKMWLDFSQKPENFYVGLGTGKLRLDPS